MAYIAGIDQGFSKTQTVLGDLTGCMLSTSRTNGASHSMHGMKATLDAIQKGIDETLFKLEISKPLDIAMLVSGMTGADWPDEYIVLSESIQSLKLAKNVLVKNDCIIALRGGTSARYGAILIAGTGANCAVKAPDGSEFIYHYYHDDRLQGGIALGRAVLQKIYRAETWREPGTSLKPIVLKHFGVATVDELLRAEVENKLSIDQIIHIAPFVFEAANQGDLVSIHILREFGVGMAELVTAAFRHFNMTNLEVEVVLSGSIFKGPGTLLSEVILTELRKVVPQVRLVNARYEPVVGAYLMGLEELGIEINQQVMERVEATAQTLGLIRVEI